MHLEIRNLSCVDKGRVFVHPLETDDWYLATGPNFVKEVEHITTLEDVVQIDFQNEKVYIYRPKKHT
tara:strand:+ start:155 stop:355 length:201 start_codon:yes stop_codon:yes gene_type:complete